MRIKTGALYACIVAASSCATPPDSPASSAPGQRPVAMATGALQRCLGIMPGGAAISPAAADAGACGQLPGADLYDQAGVRFKAGDAPGAARILTSAAEAGNPRAQLRIAMMYEQGQGVRRDKTLARSWYGRAAASGEPASQAELGGYYEEADGVPEDWQLAARLYRASAAQGWVKGQFAMGRAYEFGIGVPQDRHQAVAWFRKAAAQGHARADYFARWLSDGTNSIGFRTDAEHDLVIAGKLRFALGAADPVGITFASSTQRVEWLRGLGARVDVSEAQAFWQMRKDAYDSCQRNGGGNCVSPGQLPR
jgi:hypothetical protein